jgi:hypothetical protein
MSRIKRVVLRTEDEDGTVREYRLSYPAGTMLRFTADGRLQRRSTSDPPADMSDLRGFITARLDEDETAALAAARKRYPRWRVWLRRLRRA